MTWYLHYEDREPAGMYDSDTDLHNVPKPYILITDKEHQALLSNPNGYQVANGVLGKKKKTDTQVLHEKIGRDIALLRIQAANDIQRLILDGTHYPMETHTITYIQSAILTSQGTELWTETDGKWELKSFSVEETRNILAEWVKHKTSVSQKLAVNRAALSEIARGS